MTTDERMPDELPKHSGRVLICGDGPSLKEIDGHWGPFSMPNIAVNRSWEHFALLVDYHVTVDPKFASVWANEPRPNIVTYFWKYNFPGVWTPKLTPWEAAKEAGDYIHFRPEEGWVACCGVPAATQLAIWLGFDQIFYAGVELKGQHKHWYGKGKAPIKYLSEQRLWFQKALPLIWDRGITTWNISTDTPIPHKPVEEIFP